jgi:hypothetical protein
MDQVHHPSVPKLVSFFLFLYLHASPHRLQTATFFFRKPA